MRRTAIETESIRRKDAGAFLSVMEANKGIIYKIANSYGRNEDDKKDLIQEIVIQLWLSFDKYDERYKLSTWFYRIALNVSISFYRREKRRDEINHPIPENIIYMPEAAGTDEIGDDLQRLHQFIAELREVDRALIILYLEGYNQQEMAEILGITATNVATKVHRVKMRLKQRFSNDQSAKRASENE